MPTPPDAITGTPTASEMARVRGRLKPARVPSRSIEVSRISPAPFAATVFANRSEIESLIVGVNAFRGQVFKGEYHRNVLMDGELMPDESAVKLVDTPQWQSILKSINDENKWCTGDAKVFKTIQPTNFVSRTIPDAVGVGLLGMQAAEKQHWCEPITLVPRYIKKSAAEENSAEEKSAKEKSAKENSVKENTVQ